MAETTEPRALSAAMSQPAFVTKGGGLAMHVANRHSERWAPEAGASRVRPLRNLAFVDRMVAPWLEAAQRSQSLRLFSQYLSSGMGERAGGAVSWVFPRPWYQDELDWMASARQVSAPIDTEQPSPTMLTTRGTYVAAAPVPAQLMEYVAPSLSVARPDVVTGAQAYSPLVPFAAAQAAQVMASVAQRAPKMVGPGLRAVLANVLERAARPEAAVTAAAGRAPELVTPPAPRPELEGGAEQRVIEQAIAQREKIVELQRVARIVAERELAARAASASASASASVTVTATATATATGTATATATGSATATEATERARIESRIAERLAERQQEATRASQDRAARVERAQEAARAEAARTEAARTEAARTEAARTDAARRTRLHDQARDAAARDARNLELAPETAQPAPSPEPRIGAEVAAALSSLPPELASAIASNIAQRPEHAAQAIRELDEALRAIEFIARTSAAGGTLDSTRGPRLAMPAGLGGLLATIASAREPALGSRPSAFGSPLSAPGIADLESRPSDRARSPKPEARSPGFRLPSLAWVSADGPTSALGAAVAHSPAALAHVAWSDRWLARFAGASAQSLDTLDAASASPTRLASLAAAAPGAVFVSPDLARAFDASGSPGIGAAGLAASTFAATTAPSTTRAPMVAGMPPSSAAMPPVMRFDDDAETPDELFAQISAAATRSRAPAPVTAQPELPPPPRDTAADLVAHAAPSAPGAGLSAALASSPFAAALRHVMPMPAAPSFDVRALFGSGLAASYLAGLLEPGLRATGYGLRPDTERSWLEWSPTFVAPDVSDPEARSPEPEALSTSLLAPEPAAPLSRRLVDALALPMIGETAAVRGQANERAVAFGAPGMVGDRAQAWSVAQERSAADLALDFVSPELVLAARVYGLGPAEAAQAARIALAGPGQLSAMAGAVDRTFVAVLGIDADKKADARRAPAATTAYPVAPETETAQSPSRAMFGVDRRAPRGAFLWPQATISALGLHAPTPEGELAMPVAALELLAAQAVAEIGTFAALGEPNTASPSTGEPKAESRKPKADLPEADVLATAASLVPAARREKFEQLYVALGQSTAGREWSPAARAARAIALAGRGEDSISPRERASIAWDVLPAVYAAPGDAAAPELAQRRPELVSLAATVAADRSASLTRETGAYAIESRPGLAPLSARAGEALGSYVAPALPPQATAGSASASSSSREGAVHRAPSAAPELVRTGRPSGRHGGGEVEIPPWFEAAARRMFEDKSGSPEISLAELTLVTAAPSTHVAASSVAAPTAVPHAPMPGTQASTAQTPQIDIEKVANEVYRQILVLMDTARARNGEPYL